MSNTVLKGGVTKTVYKPGLDKRLGQFFGKIGDALGKVAGYVPDVLAAASQAVSLMEFDSPALGNTGSSRLDHILRGPSASNRIPDVKPIPLVEIPESESPSIGRRALASIRNQQLRGQREQTTERYVPYQPDPLARRALFNAFRLQQEGPHNHKPGFPSAPSGSGNTPFSAAGTARGLDPAFGRRSSGFVPETPRNLANLGQQPMSLSAFQQQRQASDRELAFLNRLRQHIQNTTPQAGQPEAKQPKSQPQPARQQKPTVAQPLRGRIEHTEYLADVRELFPQSSYWDRENRETVDLTRKLIEGAMLSDHEMEQVILDLDKMRYTAQSEVEKVYVEILEENTQNRVVDIILAHAPRTPEGLVRVYGLALYPEEAELAVTLDVEHFWKKEVHLRPEEVRALLEDFAVELWEVTYGEDIRTLTDSDAHLLQRAWAGVQLLPALKVTKLAKLSRFARFFRKTDNLGLGANPFKGKTPRQIHKMMTKNNRYEVRGAGNPLTVGKASYVNPKTGRSFHLDLKGRGKYPGEASHVDGHYKTKKMERIYQQKYGTEKRKYWGVKDE